MAKQKVTLVLDDLTLGDMEAYEDATGCNLLEDLTPKPVIDPETKMPVKDPDDDKGRPLMRVRISSATHTALIYLGLKREDPTVTIDQVRAMKLTDIDFDLQTGDPSPLDESAENGDAPE